MEPPATHETTILRAARVKWRRLWILMSKIFLPRYSNISGYATECDLYFNHLSAVAGANAEIADYSLTFCIRTTSRPRSSDNQGCTVSTCTMYIAIYCVFIMKKLSPWLSLIVWTVVPYHFATHLRPNFCALYKVNIAIMSSSCRFLRKTRAISTCSIVNTI